MKYKLLSYCERKCENVYFVYSKKRIGNGIGIIEINETGKFILKMLTLNIEIEAIISKLLTEFELEEEMRQDIKNDVLNFMYSLSRFGLLIFLDNESMDSRIDSIELTNYGLDKYKLLQSLYVEKQLPYKFFVELTYSCNLRCRHCYKTESVKQSLEHVQFLDVVYVFSILDQIEKLGAIEVYLTGGEIFLHPNIIDIIKYASTKDFRLILLTNGTMLANSNFIEQLRNIEIYDIRISIYGTEELHDKMTTVIGSYKKSIKALKNIKASMGIGTAVHVVTNENFSSVNELMTYLKKEEINVSLNTQLTPTSLGELFPLNFRISADQYKELLNEYNIPLTGTSCSAGLSKFRVTPNGDVLPCELIKDIAFGNIFKEKLSKIIEGEKRKNFIRDFSKILNHHNCNKCELQDNCNFCPALFLMENGDYSIPSSYLCNLSLVKKNKLMEKYND